MKFMSFLLFTTALTFSKPVKAMENDLLNAVFEARNGITKLKNDLKAKEKVPETNFALGKKYMQIGKAIKK